MFSLPISLGKCTRGDHCPFIHDPERVAVCTKYVAQIVCVGSPLLLKQSACRFLRGVCSKMDGTCPFYHKVTKEKVTPDRLMLPGSFTFFFFATFFCAQMPVCSFFLRGVCARDECPYLHVSVGKNADVCPDFVKGYCPRGEQVGVVGMCRCLDCCVFAVSVTVVGSVTRSTSLIALSSPGVGVVLRGRSVL